MRNLGLCVAALVLPAAAYAAEEAPLQASVASETHATSNALDGPVARFDLYQLLRGSIAYKIGDASASTTLAAEAQATAYDRYAIEDDRAAAVSVEHRRRIGRFELRGALSFRASSEGDDLTAGDTVIGIRTTTAVLAGDAEIGVDLGDGYALILGLSDAHENHGRTHFENAILPPLRLEADADRLRGSVSLRRTAGRFIHGATATVGRTAFEILGNPPVSVSSSSASLRGELRYAAGDGTALAGSLGVERFRAENGLYDRMLPIWELAAVSPVGKIAEIKGVARAGFDTVDTDDPLASYKKRAEIELGVPIREGLKISAGIFGEIKDNLLLENEERAQGVYAEIAYQTSKRFTVLLRGDWRDEFQTVFDTRTTVFDGFLRVAYRL